MYFVYQRCYLKYEDILLVLLYIFTIEYFPPQLFPLEEFKYVFTILSVKSKSGRTKMKKLRRKVYIDIYDKLGNLLPFY